MAAQKVLLNWRSDPISESPMEPPRIWDGEWRMVNGEWRMSGVEWQDVESGMSAIGTVHGFSHLASRVSRLASRV